MAFLTNAQPMRILIRYNDALSNQDMFAEHHGIVQSYGYVGFGKFGQGLAIERVEIARDQLRASIPTYVYFAVHKIIPYRAMMVDLRSGGVHTRLHSPEPQPAPAYYRDQKCAAWFKIKDFGRVLPDDVADLSTYSDPNSIGIKFNGA